MNIVERNAGAAPCDLPDDLPHVLRRIYVSRNIHSAFELSHALEHMHPFTSLSGLDQATALLESALRTGQRILIVADFDADGATSCALAVRALRLMGARDVHYIVPNRFEYGYGLTPEIVAVAAQQNPNLIITVDNGISSIEGVQAAQKLGIRVLITDHHLPGATLPAADAIINPNQHGDTFPSKHLAGVGVIFYVMLALRAHLRKTNWFKDTGMSEPNLAQFLDLVALGTVADVAVLDHNNRILVAQGLLRMRRAQCCAGIQALMQISAKCPERICSSDLGFALAPRLNAAGRLEDMSLGIECLLSDDLEAALVMAGRLHELNQQRRTIESAMHEQALANLKGLQLDAACLPSGLCLFDVSWHQGVIGILAARIKERVHRPVIAFANANDGELKGSARSVPGFHIRDGLEVIATQNPGLLTKFGGHAMAAGLTLKRVDFDTFSAAFDAQVKRHLPAAHMQGTIETDGVLAADELDIHLAEALRSAQPWGQGFPEPVFTGTFEVITQRVVGGKHLKLLLQAPDSEKLVDAIAFNTPCDDLMRLPARIHIAYRLDVNEYRGQRSLQLLVLHME
jgi:single-stranded-DNA-specific exonuclease